MKVPALPRRIHFLGIGGAGMSAIAKVLLECGYEITGSDLKRSRAATVLETMGVKVQIGHDAAFLESCSPDMVVISSAIPATNPELVRAREAGITVLGRGEVLASILESQTSIVVAGTHGKTTTTSMIVTVLRAAGLDPTYLIGGGLNDAGTNARFGTSGLAVAESDESDGSFLLLSPHIAVITNVEADHLDHWGSTEALHAAFEEFVDRTASEGAVIVPATDGWLVELAQRSGRAITTFDGDGDVTATEVQVLATGSRFVLNHEAGSATVELRVPGRHNVTDALAAAAACLSSGIALEDVATGLAIFAGVERRFQMRGTVSGVTIIDDYAHHPTEVKATLEAARAGPWSRVVAVFQPHRYSRTACMYADFGGSFADADLIVLTDVYAAGEEPVPGITGKLIVDQTAAALPGRPIAYIPHRAELVNYLSTTLRPGDMLLTLGAGDITTVGDELLERLEAAS